MVCVMRGAPTARRLRWWSLPVWLLLIAAAAQGGGFVLDLPGGGQLPGRFLPSAGPSGPLQTFGWEAAAFGGPFDFRLSEIIAVRGPVSEQAGRGGFSCRLQGGDTIEGDLLGIDERSLLIKPSAGEPLTIALSVVTGVSRRKAGNEAGFAGPGGLAGWEQSPASSWQDAAGRISTDVPHAAVARDLGGPARARYDIVLSWQERPEFLLALAAGGRGEPGPFRLELLNLADGEPAMILVRQEPDAAMIEPVPWQGDDRARLRLTLFVDQQAGRLALAVPGRDVVDLTVPPPAGRPRASTFRLQLISGDICLERLRVAAWDSATPVPGDPALTSVIAGDGRVITGERVVLDDAGQLTIGGPTGEKVLPLAELEEISFGAAGGDAALDPAPGAAVRVVGGGGLIATGTLMGIDQAGLTLGRAGVDGLIEVPFDQLESLVSLTRAEPSPMPGRIGTLRIGEAACDGCLVDAAAWGGGIAWQPSGSVTAAPLAGPPDTVSAVVEYVAPLEDAADDAGQVAVGGIGAAVNVDADGGFVLTMLSEAGAAARDGRIEVGDRVVAVRPVEGGPFVDAAGLGLETVMNLMRGRVGTPVSLRIQRGGEGRPKRIDLVRGLIYMADPGVLAEALAAHARVAAGRQAGPNATAGFPSLLVLRSGDVANAVIERIDAAGIVLRTPVAVAAGGEAVVIPHALVRAVELDPGAESRTMTPDQFERLLTLPRSQRDSPPTHLLRLRSGDYLRCCLDTLDAEEARITLLGRPKQLPREAIVRIIWLQPDEIDFGDGTPGPTEAAPAPADGLLVQGITSAGGRTTIVAERLEEATIIGTSPAFGKAQIDTREIDRLLVGQAVGADETDLPFARWKLRLAPLPRALREGD